MTQQPQQMTRDLFSDPVVQLAALCPICALAALSPAAALAALSPSLRPFNPALNPAATLLAYVRANPQDAVTIGVRARVGTRLGGLWMKMPNGR